LTGSRPSDTILSGLKKKPAYQGKFPDLPLFMSRSERAFLGGMQGMKYLG